MVPYLLFCGIIGGSFAVWGGVRIFKAKLGRLFLAMAQGKTPVTTKELYKDDKVIVFLDRQPGSKFHALVVPAKKIQDMNSLTTQDLELLQHMKKVGIEVAEKSGVDSVPKLGFVIPPWNTVGQLHMHIMSLPLTEKGIRRWVFDNRFADIDSVIQKFK